MEDNNDAMFNVAINDHRFNPLEMSQNYSHREPKFCFCLPLSKGVCCGLISLRITLIFIAIVDIVIGGSAIGIGVVAFMNSKLEIALVIYVIVNAVCFILAFGCLFAITKKMIKLMKFYFA